jgi:RNA polymerase sigma-70 factor (ECF subfamily)
LANATDPTGVPTDRSCLLTQLFRVHAAFVWRVVQRFGVPEADAEDAVQEVFLVVAKRLDSYDERGAVRAWLVAIARQVAMHTQRSRFRRERRAQEYPLRSRSYDPQRELENNEAIAFMDRFLSELHHDQAVVFWLAELEGMSAPEIAAGLKVNLNTVYARLRRARRRFEQDVQRLSESER